MAAEKNLVNTTIVEEEEDEHAPSYRKPSSIYLHKNDQVTESGFLKPYTPDTILTEYPFRPDISLFCEQCIDYINLKFLREHRTLHKALDVFDYLRDEIPEDVEMLLKDRTNVINQLKNKLGPDETLNPIDVEKVNYAYDLLKSQIEDTFESTRKNTDEINTTVEGVSLNCSASCVQAVGICTSQNEKWKNVLEDTRVFQDYFGNDKEKCFFAVYDGHFGSFSAEVAANKLHLALLKEMTAFDPDVQCTCALNMADNYDISEHEFSGMRSSTVQSYHDESTNSAKQVIASCDDDNKQNALLDDILKVSENPDFVKKLNRKTPSDFGDPYYSKIAKAYQKAYAATDGFLMHGFDEHSNVRWSGCSALTLMIQSEVHEKEDAKSEKYAEADDSAQPSKHVGTIYIANAGDVHAVLVRDNKAVRLSKDHTAHNTKEKKRVLKAGGVFSESDRQSRVYGIVGTTRGLGNHGDPKLRKCIINEPYTTCVKLDQYCQFLILASRGVWEILSEQEAADILSQILPSNLVSPPSRVSTSMNHILAEYTARIHSEQVMKRSETPSTCTTVPDENEATKNITSKFSDLVPETGSNTEEVYEGSGNEGDVDTLYGDKLYMKGVPLTKDEIQRQFAKTMAETLTQAALLAGARDNITVQVVLLDGSGL